MRRFALLAFALATMVSPLAAQSSHADFSGKWTLDPRSAEGPLQGATATMLVIQDAKTLKMNQTMSSPMGGEMKSALTFNLDGSPSTNTMSAQGMALELASTASWDGPTLVVKTTTELQGQTMTQTERWSLSADGKALTVQRDASVGGQSMSMKMAFTKQ